MPELYFEVNTMINTANVTNGESPQGYTRRGDSLTQSLLPARAERVFENLKAALQASARRKA